MFRRYINFETLAYHNIIIDINLDEATLDNPAIESS